MAITEEQAVERRRFLGSSDIAALFTDADGNSLDPFKSPVDVWATKVFELENKTDTPSQSIGHRYESALRQFAEKEIGEPIESTPEKLRFVNTEILGSDGQPIFACNLDGFTSSQPPAIVEIKTTGLTGEWGDPGTDAVPYRVILQVHQQMLCTGWGKAYIAVLLGRWGLSEEMFIINRDERIIDAIAKRGTDFWNGYVLTKTTPPDAEKGDIKIFKRIRREPNKYATINPDIINAWETARNTRIECEKHEKERFAAVLANLQDAEGAVIDDERELVYFTQNGKAVIDEKRLQAEYPEVYANVSRPNTFRVARIRKIK